MAEPDIAVSDLELYFPRYTKLRLGGLDYSPIYAFIDDSTVHFVG